MERFVKVEENNFHNPLIIVANIVVKLVSNFDQKEQNSITKSKHAIKHFEVIKDLQHFKQKKIVVDQQHFDTQSYSQSQE